MGSLTGSAIGLIALLLGALFNSYLNRRRDDALRSADARSVAAALRAELISIEEMLLANAKTLGSVNGEDSFYTPNVGNLVRVMPELISKLGLLDVETVKAILRAYGLIDQHSQQLILLGGIPTEAKGLDGRLVLMRNQHAPLTAQLNRNYAQTVREAVNSLDPYVTPKSRMRSRPRAA